MNMFSADVRRNPFPVYEQLRASSPVMREPSSGLWMVFDYETVKRVLNDSETFSSKYGPDWLVFADAPRHTQLRELISQAFTPRSIANLEPRIRAISRELLEPAIEQGEMDLAVDYAIQLPMMVIAEMLGIGVADRQRFKIWSDVILNMSYTIPGGPGAAEAASDFDTTTGEMNDFLTGLLAERRTAPRDDLLTRLAQAEVAGEQLTQQEILGFFQLLLLAGSETTTNLINNAMLCFMENPGQLARLRANMDLLPSAIEEVLRSRSPVQWMVRVTRREVELRGQAIPAGKRVVAVIGSANRDPAVFRSPNEFDISRDPNPHIAFGHGIHFCLGAALARLEARIALTDLLTRMETFELATNEPWEPRTGLHVLGPSRLPIRFTPSANLGAMGGLSALANDAI